MHHGIKKLLLLGAGHAHLHVLASLAQHRPADLDVTVLSPFAQLTYSGMIPGFVAGHYAEADCRIALEPLVRAAGARWVQGRCNGIDPVGNAVSVTAAGGAQGVPATLGFDTLSIDTGAVIDRARLEVDMPGAATHALAVRPIEAFAQLWPQVLQLAQRQPVSLAVVGAGAAGIELVLAAEQSIRQQGMPGARFTLVTGGPEVADSYRPAVRHKVLRQLKRRGITVLREACVGISAGEVLLSNGARLACDVPLLAIGTHAPPWLQGSGLALSDAGHVLVNAFQQSTSHPHVFAAGDVACRADTPHASSGVHAVRAGPPLAHNLLAVHQRKPLKSHQPPTNTLNLLSCGTGHAIASYGAWSVEGAWAWRWKDRIDRGFIERYRIGPRPAAQASGEPVS
ncbi:FAD-dependent oxidoreductase [Hydrogenophaga sp. PBL-H3]|uniref:FAD-dependent oxidoreductase n=1 Tax=Hydrogenophaga sp. PBL-H3 TaxID=434010 RepID=UPI00131F6D09|nr:FAD-dependent oxidoreductase [Hydrogenophaga sp. PBL-H3]QHE75446.1 pyridine nucleotide-disulfide oxidoreductase [Hydrogenophaga sp. PBL-H3]QHE79873.1 pyridine nucleotide-disulfide oxidoreductase [Hydrogenophaga sp. PBL-H3]